MPDARIQRIHWQDLLKKWKEEPDVWGVNQVALGADPLPVPEDVDDPGPDSTYPFIERPLDEAIPIILKESKPLIFWGFGIMLSDAQSREPVHYFDSLIFRLPDTMTREQVIDIMSYQEQMAPDALQYFDEGYLPQDQEVWFWYD